MGLCTAFRLWQRQQTAAPATLSTAVLGGEGTARWRLRLKEANRDKVIETLVKEEKAFRQTLRKGLKEFEKEFGTWGVVDNSIIYDTARRGEREFKKIIEGETIFKLYDTYGFPVELIYE